MSQAELFPLSEEERIARIRSLLAKDEEKTATKRINAEAALDEATESWDTASQMLATFEDMTAVCTAAARVAGVTPEGVDPVTGEVAQVDTPAPVASSFEGEKSATPVVIVLWPDDPEPHVTVIGEYTTYLELIADYSSPTDPGRDIRDMADCFVYGEDDDLVRPLTKPIDRSDYGKRLVIRFRVQDLAETAS